MINLLSRNRGPVEEYTSHFRGSGGGGEGGGGKGNKSIEGKRLLVSTSARKTWAACAICRRPCLANNQTRDRL